MQCDLRLSCTHHSLCIGRVWWCLISSACPGPPCWLLDVLLPLLPLTVCSSTVQPTVSTQPSATLLRSASCIVVHTPPPLTLSLDVMEVGSIDGLSTPGAAIIVHAGGRGRTLRAIETQPSLKKKVGRKGNRRTQNMQESV